MSWTTTGNTPQGLAIDVITNPTDPYIYCANYYSNTISKISLTNPSGNTTILNWATTGGTPVGLVLDIDITNPTNSYIYCTNNVGDSISKINLADPTIIDNNWASTGAGSYPQFLAIYNGYIYCSCNAKKRISKISLTNPSGDNNLNWAITGTYPKGLAIDVTDPLNPFIYCANNGDNSIAKITLTTTSNVDNSWATTGTNSNPAGLVIYGGYIYCAYNFKNTISKISLTNPSGDNNDNWATTGPSPFGLAIYDGNIYESNATTNTIWKINLTTPCFNKGTKILCLNSMMKEEYIPIENLKKGDLVKSYLHGYRRIDSIGSNKMINNPEHFNLSMYKMEKTDTNGLTEDLIVTGGHSILVDDLGDNYKENKIRFNGTIPKIDDKFLLLSAVSKEFTQLTDTDEYIYYHLVLENNGNNDERFGIWANGILTESMSKNYFKIIEQTLH